MRFCNTLIWRRIALSTGLLTVIWQLYSLDYDINELNKDSDMIVMNIENTTIIQRFDGIFKGQLETISKIQTEFLISNISSRHNHTLKTRMILYPSLDYFNILKSFSGIRTIEFSLPQSEVSRLVSRQLFKPSFINGTTYSGQPFTPYVQGIKPLTKLYKLIPPKDNNSLVTFLNIIQGGTVYEEGVVIHKNLEIHSNGCKSSSAIILNSPTKTTDEVFVISQRWGYGYFHFVVENLPRLASFMTFLKSNPSIKIHVSEENAFTKRFLGTLGVPAYRLISGKVRAKVVYLPAGVDCGQASVLPTQLLSLQLQSILKPSTERRSVVVIKRSARRWFDHHDSIWKMLTELQDEYDFNLELFSDNPLPRFPDTVKMFQSAVMVVAPHGAGLSNVLFSKPETVVIEGLCQNINHCYSRLSLVLGHVYQGIIPKDDCLTTTASMLREPIVSSLKWLKETSQLY